MTERWRPVANWPYEVSSHGRIRHETGRIRKPVIAGKGYLCVDLYRAGGETKRRYIHHLVLEAFQGKRPDGWETRHLDGDPTNNRLGNLAYGTRKRNAADRDRHGNTPRGRENGASKLNAVAVRVIRHLANGGRAIGDLADAYGVHHKTVWSIVNRETWRWVE